MALVKCPRCELNYMNDTDEMCSVCRREVRGESEQYDMIELCSECGENPAVPGYELCASCLKELQRRSAADTSDDVIVHAENPIDIVDSVTTVSLPANVRATSCGRPSALWRVWCVSV